MSETESGGEGELEGGGEGVADGVGEGELEGGGGEGKYEGGSKGAAEGGGNGEVEAGGDGDVKSGGTGDANGGGEGNIEGGGKSSGEGGSDGDTEGGGDCVGGRGGAGGRQGQSGSTTSEWPANRKLRPEEQHPITASVTVKLERCVKVNITERRRSISVSSSVLTGLSFPPPHWEPHSAVSIGSPIGICVDTISVLSERESSSQPDTAMHSRATFPLPVSRS